MESYRKFVRFINITNSLDTEGSLNTTNTHLVQSLYDYALKLGLDSWTTKLTIRDHFNPRKRIPNIDKGLYLL